MKNFVFLVTVLLLSACSPQVKVDQEKEKASLMTTAKAYQDACTIMDVEKIVAFYTSDAKLIPPGGAVATGTDEIRKFMVGMTELKNFQVRFEAPEVEISSGADMGYSLASVVLSYEDAAGKMVSEDHRDFHVWKRWGARGSWPLIYGILHRLKKPALLRKNKMVLNKTRLPNLFWRNCRRL